MIIRRVQRGSPEAVYIIARNCSPSQLGVGMLAHWAFWQAASTYADGMNVSYSDAGGTNTLCRPWMMAGLVARGAIPSFDWGMLQVFGPADALVHNLSATFNFSSLSNQAFYGCSSGLSLGYLTVTTEYGQWDVGGIRPMQTRLNNGTTGTGLMRVFVRLL